VHDIALSAEQSYKLEKKKEVENMVFCNECGAKNKDGVKFCSGCGGAIGLSSEPTPSPDRESVKDVEEQEDDEFSLPDKINVLKSMTTTHEFFENVAAENERKKPKKGLLLGIGGSSEEESVEYTRYLNIPYFNVFFEYEERVSVKKGLLSSELRIVEKEAHVICQGNPVISLPQFIPVIDNNNNRRMLRLRRIAEAEVRTSIDALLSQGSLETNLDPETHGTITMPLRLKLLREGLILDFIEYPLESIANITEDLKDRVKIKKTDIIFYPLYVVYFKSNMGMRRWAVFDGITGQKDPRWTRFLEEEGGYLRDILKEDMESGRK